MDYLRRLAGVDPRLVSVVMLGATRYENDTGDLVRVTSGLRTYEEQRKLYKAGKSQTMHSYHLKGKAIDLAIIREGEFITRMGDYKELNKFIDGAADTLEQVITWGGTWARFRDGCHWQIELLDPLQDRNW